MKHTYAQHGVYSNFFLGYTVNVDVNGTMLLCLTASRQRAACQINYKSIETSVFLISIASFKWMCSEGDRFIQLVCFLSHNIYRCLSFSMNKRVCDVHLDFIFIRRIGNDRKKINFALVFTSNRYNLFI